MTLAVGTPIYGWNSWDGQGTVIYTTSEQWNVKKGDSVYNIYGEVIDTVVNFSMEYIGAETECAMWVNDSAMQGADWATDTYGSSLNTTVQASTQYVSNLSDGTNTYAIKDAEARTSISNLATVATTGSYNDLSNKPTIPAAQVNSDWNASSGVAQILNKPTIPTVNNATLTITQGGVSKGTFTANASSNVTIALDAGGGGGSSYTAGTGIDITNNVISAEIDTNTGLVSSQSLNYCGWTYNGTTYYTLGSNPSVGDTVYIKSGGEFVPDTSVEITAVSSNSITLGSNTVTLTVRNGHNMEIPYTLDEIDVNNTPLQIPDSSSDEWYTYSKNVTVNAGQCTITLMATSEGEWNWYALSNNEYFSSSDTGNPDYWVEEVYSSTANQQMTVTKTFTITANTTVYFDCMR